MNNEASEEVIKKRVNTEKKADDRRGGKVVFSFQFPLFSFFMVSCWFTFIFVVGVVIVVVSFVFWFFPTLSVIILWRRWILTHWQCHMDDKKKGLSSRFIVTLVWERSPELVFYSLFGFVLVLVQCSIGTRCPMRSFWVTTSMVVPKISEYQKLPCKELKSTEKSHLWSQTKHQRLPSTHIFVFWNPIALLSMFD